MCVAYHGDAFNPLADGVRSRSLKDKMVQFYVTAKDMQTIIGLLQPIQNFLLFFSTFFSTFINVSVHALRPLLSLQ